MPPEQQGQVTGDDGFISEPLAKERPGTIAPDSLLLIHGYPCLEGIITGRHHYSIRKIPESEKYRARLSPVSPQVLPELSVIQIRGARGIIVIQAEFQIQLLFGFGNSHAFYLPRIVFRGLPSAVQ